jgi:dienelactone hydrolase
MARSPAAFPVILYFPGWSGTRIDNVALLGELASRGFVVVAVHYPTDASAAAASLMRPMDFSSEAALADTVERADKMVRGRARDAAAILTALAGMNGDATSRFAHRLDLDRAAIFGFSLGGAVAAQAGWLDQRFKAVINLDGWQFGDAAEQGVSQPYLILSDSGPPPSAEDLISPIPVRRYASILDKRDLEQLFANFERRGGYFVTVAGTEHVNFSDDAFASPIRRLTGAGPIDPRRALRITADYCAAFFETVLDRRPSVLFDPANATYPETRLQIWPRPA